MTEQERVEKVARAIYEKAHPSNMCMDDWDNRANLGKDNSYREQIMDQARAAIAALTVMPQEADPRCAKCGHPKSNHPYRHLFVAMEKDAAMDRLVAEGQRCDAMTPQEAAKVLLDALERKYNPRNPLWNRIVDSLSRKVTDLSRVRGSDGILTALRAISEDSHD